MLETGWYRLKCCLGVCCYFFVPLVVLVGDTLPVTNTGTRVEGAGFDTDLSPLNSIDIKQMQAVQGVPHPITLLAQCCLTLELKENWCI